MDSSKKIAVVTGATSDLGKCFISLLKGLHYQVCLVAKDSSKISSLLKTLKKSSPKNFVIKTFLFDLSKKEDAQKKPIS